MMMAGGGASGPPAPRGRRITGSRIAMASGTHGEIASGGAGATRRGRAATRSGPAGSDIPRDRNAPEVQAFYFPLSRFAFKMLSR